MSETTDPDAPPVQRRSAIVNFPTDTDIDAEYGDAEILHTQGVDDDAAKKLAALTQVTSLSLNGELTDDGLAHFAGSANLANLEHLHVSSPNVTAAGFKAFQGATALQSLTIEQAQITPKGVRRIGKLFPSVTRMRLASNSLGLDHLVMLPAHGNLQSFDFQGGGDFLGGGDGELDRATATSMVAGCPKLESVNLTWSNGKSMLGDHTVVAMLTTHPGLTVNGTWYNPKVFEQPGRTNGNGNGNGVAAANAPAEIVDLTSDNFDDFIATTPVALVHLWTSSENGCQAALMSIRTVAGNVEQLPAALGGRAAVARVDEHTTGDLTKEIREKHDTGWASLLVFKDGEVVGRLSAWQPNSMVALLAPVLD